MAQRTYISAVQAAQAGFVAITTVTSLLVLGNRIGVLRLQFGRYLGTLFLPISRAALLIGWALHFLHGVLFAIPYAFLLNRTKPSTWIRKGAVLGIVHSFIGLLALVFLGKFHPRPEQAQVKPFHRKAYGIFTVPGMVVGHMLYGAIIGWFFQKEVSRKES